jgi:hypothetical protein
MPWRQRQEDDAHHWFSLWAGRVLFQIDRKQSWQAAYVSSLAVVVAVAVVVMMVVVVAVVAVVVVIGLIDGLDEIRVGDKSVRVAYLNM